MRWRRAIVAVVVGVLTSAVTMAVLYKADAFYRVQESAARIVPRGVSYKAYEMALEVSLGTSIALPGIIIAVLIAATGRTPAPNRCRACGYDLTGNTSGRCPECGEPA